MSHRALGLEPGICCPPVVPGSNNLGDETMKLTLKEIAKKYEAEMQCNCDLDNWQPELNTGHSHVCRIHKAAMAEARKQ